MLDSTGEGCKGGCLAHEKEKERSQSQSKSPQRPHAHEDVEEDDTLIESDGATLIVDALSFQYLVGAEVDFKEDLSGARFVVTNPNASTTCGCGNSFSL